MIQFELSDYKNYGPWKFNKDSHITAILVLKANPIFRTGSGFLSICYDKHHVCHFRQVRKVNGLNIVTESISDSTVTCIVGVSVITEDISDIVVTQIVSLDPILEDLPAHQWQGCIVALWHASSDNLPYTSTWLPVRYRLIALLVIEIWSDNLDHVEINVQRIVTSRIFVCWKFYPIQTIIELCVAKYIIFKGAFLGGNHKNCELDLLLMLLIMGAGFRMGIIMFVCFEQCFLGLRFISIHSHILSFLCFILALSYVRGIHCRLNLIRGFCY